MLPGKKYEPEDVLKILRKRIWLIVAPWAVIAAGTAGIARELPDLFQSTALIQVVPPQVPANIVRPVNSESLEARLPAMQQTILSRTRLERLIMEFNLYEKERKSQIMEEVVQNMRDDIRVNPVKGDAFTVSYKGRNPLTVMKVTERLAGYFKDESLRDGTMRAEGTNSFVESQAEEAKRRLLETEAKLTQYKIRYAGELPEQLGANMQAIQSINQNLNAVGQAMNSDQSSKLMLERLIAAAESQADAVQPVTGGDGTIVTGTAAQRLTAANAQLAQAQLTLGPNHPTIRLLQNAIRSLEKEASDEALRAPVGTAASVTPADKARQLQLAGWHEDLDRVNKRIATHETEEKQLRASAAAYQAKIDRIPTRQAELIELNRDYDSLNGIYQGLVGQREASNASLNLERRQIGEQFNLLDAARLPEKPYSPNRTLINMFGILGGLAVGLGLVALFEYRDRTFKADTELAGVLGLPVLAVVPLMRSPAERRVEFRKRIIVNLGLGSTVAVCVAVLTYTFVFVR